MERTFSPAEFKAGTERKDRFNPCRIYGTINHELLLNMAREEIAAEAVIRLIKLFPKAESWKTEF